MDDPSTFNQYKLLRKEAPEKLILFRKSKNEGHQKIKANIETFLGIETKIIEILEQSFSKYLKEIYDIITKAPDDQYLLLGVNAPREALMAAFVLGSFFDIRIDLQENGQDFTIPNQSALALVKKKINLLKTIQNEKPDSIRELLTILLKRKLLNGTRKNIRAKVSYTIGILQRNGIVSINRGERGKLKISLTPIGKELLKIL